MTKFYTSVLQHRSTLLVSGYENGKRFYKKVKYKPYLFAQSKNPTKYRTIHGQPVEKMNFPSIWEANQFIKTYENVDNFKIYGLNRYAYPYIYENFQGCKADKSLLRICINDIEVSTRGGNPDIEAANKEITAITCQYPNQNVTFTFGLGDYDIKDRTDLFYFKCKDEREILLRLIKLWSSDNYRPDVITGWNIEFFDIPYIVKRITQVLGYDFAKRLSPFGVLDEREVESHNKLVKVFVPLGVNILDYIALYKKFTYSQQETYALDHIAYVELGEKKVVWKDKYDTLDDLADADYQLFIDYNLHDCELVKRINDKMKLLELVFDFAYDSGINYIDTVSAVRTTDVIIHNELMDHCVVIPHGKSEKEMDRKPEGGFVKDPQTGMFSWVMSVDLTSMYPMRIWGSNIGPDTVVKKSSLKSKSEKIIASFMNEDSLITQYKVEDYLERRIDPTLIQALKDSKLTLCANGAVYRTEKQSFLSALMEKLFGQRKIYKNKMLDFQKLKEKEHTPKYDNEIAMFKNLQLATKVKLNSVYGVLANPYFRWNDIIFAESITITGQLTIRWAEKHINKFLNEYLKTEDVDYVIAVDTDSLYLNMQAIAEQSGLEGTYEIHDYIKDFAENTLQPFLDQIYVDLGQYLNSPFQKCEMKLEVIADRGIFVAKKKYCLNVLSSEGVLYEKPKMKIMGIEAVRSSTPEFCRKSIKEALGIIMTKDIETLRTFLDGVKEDFDQKPFNVVASPRTVNGMEKYHSKVTHWSKGTPMHVRAAMVYNLNLKARDLEKKYSPIYDRDKIKYCYLMMPNPVNSNVIAATDDLPKEFDLDKYIDYDTQFEKALISPLQIILDAIGWQIKKENSLERWLE